MRNFASALVCDGEEDEHKGRTASYKKKKKKVGVFLGWTPCAFKVLKKPNNVVAGDSMQTFNTKVSKLSCAITLKVAIWIKWHKTSHEPQTEVHGPFQVFLALCLYKYILISVHVQAVLSWLILHSTLLTSCYKTCMTRGKNSLSINVTIQERKEEEKKVKNNSFIFYIYTRLLIKCSHSNMPIGVTKMIVVLTSSHQ